MQGKFRRLAGAFILAVSGPATVSAATTVLLDNLSLAQSESFLAVQLSQPGQWAASPFSTPTTTPGDKFALEKITLRLGTDLGFGSIPAATAFSLSIFSDASGAPGTTTTQGTLLSAAISNPTGNVNAGLPQLFEFLPTTAGSILLEQGSSFWARLTGNLSTLGGGVVRADVVVDGLSAVEHCLSCFSPFHVSGYSLAMKVEASQALAPVPIPGAVWLMGSALIGFAGWGRRLQV